MSAYETLGLMLQFGTFIIILLTFVVALIKLSQNKK